MKKKISLLLAAVMILSLFVGCAAKPAEQAKEDAAPAHENKLSIVIPNDIMSLDPAQSSSDTDYFINHSCIYEGLTNIDPHGEVIPQLAESWDVSEDGLTYTFHLLKDVKFHNGETMKASDVIFSLNYAKESPFLASIGELYTTCTAVDDNTVEVVLAAPFAPFLSRIGDVFIYSEKAFTEAGDSYASNPVGTGPFKFGSYTLGKELVLDRFDDYHLGAASLEQITFKIIADSNTAQLALEAGDVDYVCQLPQISYEDLSKNEKLSVFKVGTRELNHITMNFNHPPFDNVLVRQALNYAVNKEDIVSMALEGFGVPADYVLNDQFLYYSEDVKGYSYDVEKAKELLAEAGYPDGFTCTLDTCDNYKKAAENIQEQLSKIGITCTMNMGDQNAMMENVASGNYDIAVFMWVLDPQADSWKYIFKTGEVVNYAPYSNPEVDAMFDEAASQADASKSQGIYNELFQKLNDDAVMVPLFHSIKLSASSSQLSIPNFDIFGYPVLYEVSWN